MPARFVELPGRERMFVRHAIGRLGGEIAQYAGNGFQVAMPKGQACQTLQATLEAFGYTKIDACLFPLTNPNAPARLRHTGPYQRHDDPNPAYWYYHHYEPADDLRPLQDPRPKETPPCDSAP